MTTQQAIDIIKNEAKCAKRADKCSRDCANCLNCSEIFDIYDNEIIRNGRRGW